MPYYTGAANSMAGLLESVTAACVAEGWTWADNILSKETVFVSFEVAEAGESSRAPLIFLSGGTGRDNGTLLNPSNANPFMGRISFGSNFESISYPCTYHLFVFDNPAEVFLVVQYGIDWHAWLAFGQSALSGMGPWIAANGLSGIYQAINIRSYGINNRNYACGGFFWRDRFYGYDSWDCDINDGSDWLSSTANLFSGFDTGAIAAAFAVRYLTERSPNSWNDESVLLPIQPHLRVDGNKIQMLADIQNARYIRVDNYDSGQILTIGSEQWMVFPFIRKNTAARGGGLNIDHTGTFGWAIRYDGNS